MSEGDLSHGQWEFEDLLLQGMLWEFSETKGGPKGIEGDLNKSCTQLGEGVLPLSRLGNRQLHTSGSFFIIWESKFSPSIRGNIVGHAWLALQGRANPHWVCLMETPPESKVIYNVQATAQATSTPDQDPLQSERTRHLVTQLGLMYQVT